MNITLTGNLGSGKSTICKIICDEYGFEKYSTGVIMRQMAEERGITVLEMNELSKTDKSFDNMIDDRTRAISHERINDKIIFDSRLAWHFAEKSFKVFLSVSLDEAARRVFGDSRGEVETYTSVEDARQQLKERAEVENARYREFYDIEYFDFHNYNLVLDSTSATPEQLVKVFMQTYEDYVKSGEQGSERIVLSTERFCGKLSANEHEGLVFPGGKATIVYEDGEIAIKSGKEIAEQAAKLGYTFFEAELA